MKPVSFDQQNVIFAENQDEYLNLPAYREPNGEVVCCFELDDDDLININKDRKIWVFISTFNHPLQPIGMQTNHP